MDEVACEPTVLTLCTIKIRQVDPHMTGFLGQKFDFTGLDGEWYCLIKDDHIQVSHIRCEFSSRKRRSM